MDNHMTKHIFRVPVDEDHFKLTIVNNQSYTELLPFLTFSEKDNLKPLADSNNGDLRYWGSQPGPNNVHTFKQLEIGDEILFYRGGKYVALATVAYTTVNQALARHTWEEDKKSGDTWELIYFLTDVKLLSLETAMLNEQWGMKGGHVMGFSKLNDERVQPFLKEHGSVARFLDKQKKAA